MMFVKDPLILSINILEEIAQFSSIRDDLQDIQDDAELLYRILHLGNIGPWEETDAETIYLTPYWCRLFGVQQGEIQTLQDYLVRIDNTADRDIVEKARTEIRHHESGTVWNGVFPFCGKMIQSSFCVNEQGIVFGVDTLLYGRNAG